MDNFTAPDAAYREQVLPPQCRARVAVEAAEPARLGQVDRDSRERRRDGDVRRIGPGGALYEHFGITAGAGSRLGREVVKRVRSTG